MTNISEINFFNENVSHNEVLEYLKSNNYDIGLCRKKDGSIGYLLVQDVLENNKSSIN